MKRYCLALDLIDDPQSIREYEKIHEDVWPEIEKSFRDAGILKMEIYRVDNRLFMILDVESDFRFEEKERMDQENPVVQKWEEMMWKYQQAIPGSQPHQKWRLMKNIYDFHQ